MANEIIFPMSLHVYRAGCWNTFRESSNRYFLLKFVRRLSDTASSLRPGLILGCGSNVVDHFVYVNNQPVRSSKSLLSHDDSSTKTNVSPNSWSHVCVGGVTLNHLSWASRLGAKCGLLAAQGTDSIGESIREACKQYGIFTENIVVSSQYSSSSSVVFYNSKGERSIVMARGATSLMDREFVKEHFSSSLDKACILSTEISQVPLSGVLYLLRRASEKGIPSVLDVDVSLTTACQVETKLGSELEFIDCLQNASVVKLSLSEAESLVRYLFPSCKLDDTTCSVMQFSSILLEKLSSAKMVIVTLGSRGSVLTSNVGSVFVASHNSDTRVVDTTGAGDAYLGGVLAYLYHYGFPNSESRLLILGQVASRCASLCCGFVGGLAPLDFSLETCLTDLKNSRDEAWFPESHV